MKLFEQIKKEIDKKNKHFKYENPTQSPTFLKLLDYFSVEIYISTIQLGIFGNHFIMILIFIILKNKKTLLWEYL